MCIARLCVAGLGIARRRLAWLNLAWLNLSWLSLAWRGLAWLGLAGWGLAWRGLAWLGEVGIVALVGGRSRHRVLQRQTELRTTSMILGRHHNHDEPSAARTCRARSQ